MENGACEKQARIAHLGSLGLSRMQFLLRVLPQKVLVVKLSFTAGMDVSVTEIPMVVIRVPQKTANVEKDK